MITTHTSVEATTGSDTSPGPDTPRATGSLVDLSSTAYEAIRAINHHTITGDPIPAPDLYPVLGELRCLAHGLDQTLRLLGRSLTASLAVLDVYEDDGADPHMRASAATAQLGYAADLAHTLATSLDVAQGAIARQGYHPTPDPDIAAGERHP